MRHLSTICLLILTLILLVSPTRAVGWTAEVTKLDLTAGQEASAYLAPDGSQFAYFKDNGFCLYTLEGKKGDCVVLEDDINIDLETVRWSPDSTKLAFSEDFFRFANDSDIWMWDTEGNTLSDLTPAKNRQHSNLPSIYRTAVYTVDMLPQWAADSQSIYFIRYQYSDGDDARPNFSRIAVEGGEPEKITSAKTDLSFPTKVFAISPDESRIAYNLDSRGDDQREQYGTWFLDVATGEAKFAVAVKDTQPWAYQFSPNGNMVLSVGESFKMGTFAVHIMPGDSAIYTLPVFGGRQQQLDADNFVFAAGWAPEGSALAYTTYYGNYAQMALVQGLYISSAPGVQGEIVLKGHFGLTTPLQRVPIMWAANNTLLLMDGDDLRLVVVRLKES